MGLSREGEDGGEDGGGEGEEVWDSAGGEG